jgi:hypothetical protein
MRDKTSEYTREERDLLCSCIENACQESLKIRRARGEIIGVLGTIHGRTDNGYVLNESYFTDKQWDSFV